MAVDVEVLANHFNNNDIMIHPPHFFTQACSDKAKFSFGKEKSLNMSQTDILSVGYTHDHSHCKGIE